MDSEEEPANEQTVTNPNLSVDYLANVNMDTGNNADDYHTVGVIDMDSNSNEASSLEIDLVSSI